MIIVKINELYSSKFNTVNRHFFKLENFLKVEVSCYRTQNKCTKLCGVKCITETYTLLCMFTKTLHKEIKKSVTQFHRRRKNVFNI